MTAQSTPPPAAEVPEQAIRADVLAVDEKLNPRQATLVTAFLERARLTLADCKRLFPDSGVVLSSAV